ncbi:hypothetical protein D3C75_770280 [compost metagenome]
MLLMHNTVAEHPVDLRHFSAQITQQIDNVGGLLRKLSAGLLLVAPPGYTGHAAHPLPDNHTHLVTAEQLLQPCDIFLIPEVVAHRGEQPMLLDILQQAGRNLRAGAQRLFHKKGDFPADQRPLNRSMRLRRHTNIHGIQLVGIQHLCDFPIPFSAVGTSHVFTLLPAAAADRLELHILHS